MKNLQQSFKPAQTNSQTTNMGIFNFQYGLPKNVLERVRTIVRRDYRNRKGNGWVFIKEDVEVDRVFSSVNDTLNAMKAGHRHYVNHQSAIIVKSSLGDSPVFFNSKEVLSHLAGIKQGEEFSIQGFLVNVNKRVNPLLGSLVGVIFKLTKLENEGVVQVNANWFIERGVTLFAKNDLGHYAKNDFLKNKNLSRMELDLIFKAYK